MVQSEVTARSGPRLTPLNRDDAMALRLAEVSYLRLKDAVKVATDAGWSAVDTADRRGVQVVFALHERTAFVAFRGTSEDLDLAYDLFFAPPLKRPMRHPGFSLAWRAVRSQVKAWLAAHQSQYERIILTGHSLGGAIAALAALDLASEFHICRVVTFGMPRTFWLGGASNYDRTVVTSTGRPLGDVTIRYVNADDLIPRIVPWLFGYLHVGIFAPCGASPLHGLESGLTVLLAVISPGSQSGGTTVGSLESWRSTWRAGLGIAALAIAISMPPLLGALIMILVLRAVLLSIGSHGARRYMATLDVPPMPRSDRQVPKIWTPEEPVAQVKKDRGYRIAPAVIFALLAAGIWWQWTKWGWLSLLSSAITQAIAIAVGAVIVMLLLRVDRVNNPWEIFGFSEPKRQDPYGFMRGAVAPSFEDAADPQGADSESMSARLPGLEWSQEIGSTSLETGPTQGDFDFDVPPDGWLGGPVPSAAQLILDTLIQKPEAAPPAVLDGSAVRLGAAVINPFTRLPWGSLAAALLIADDAPADEEE